ncbi:Holliday junction resolvase RecU [Erysipelothrix rhusiopathiae]|uniref:Holliday junction resolvase RecU n=1 Tax=Erysipelothrix rhusiopathiae TaxID=1648 RepID=UPI000210B53A|nr:Holliday junction resolvase RecU [Erysipelothrix rhusiopathiae]AGN23847.1 Holliday junction-specific endonuclease [Erysipelothrix rhusiopathiae SY1027]AMS11343.1 Holliday junction resolvase RecU [Erysipelothrix rhusiopathiae]AOO67840.1 recombination protein U [Erysipelothrix rhusiopathiae]AWU41309.1 Holliday junction resolvase RecU [Erysipelothrix rhusiopathiae]MCG4436573.1 Holliday junction resolvase RecU [Erysipelothrix rhusiopathiae]
MIQYPTGKKTYNKPSGTGVTSRRGMSLEEDINKTNDHYLTKDMAVVHKKPTPIQIVNVDYPSRNKAKITEAYFRQASTTDYQGVYKGYALDFEAKETKNKTLFPLAALHQHQLDHLAAVSRHGAIAFLIIRFWTIDETYLIFAKDFVPYISEKQVRSLPLSWIRTVGFQLESTYQIPCHYLDIINRVYIKECL